MSTSSNDKGAAVVTGAARGIGLAVAQKLAEDGYAVVLNDLPQKQELLTSEVDALRSKGYRAIAVPGDMTLEDEVKNLVQQAVTEFGSLDVMIANAGTMLYKSMEELTVEDWDRTFAINVRSIFLCYREAGAQMIKQGRGGRILGASSLAGKRGFPVTPAYTASKFAVRGLTQSAACDYGQYGITVNAYAPGAINTPLMDETDKMQSEKHGWARGTSYEIFKQQSPLGMMGDPDDIAGLVSYLVSPAARFITGQTVSINGGLFFD